MIEEVEDQKPQPRYQFEVMIAWRETRREECIMFR
jgi:hypothetical protein